jgi:hypothetical protein
VTKEEENRRLRKREAQLRYRQKNREKLREWNRIYAEKYRAANPEKVRAGRRAWRDANREHANKKAKEYALAHPEKMKELRDRWRQENRDKMKDFKLRKNYGIGLEDYDLIFEEQSGLCAICKNPPQEKYFDVDHDHVTGLVRGLLCKPCNKAIGFLQDNPENADASARYLRKTQKNGNDNGSV